MIIRWIVCVLVGFLCVMPLAAETPKFGFEKFGNTPLVFEPNYGQVDSSVRFLSRGDRYGLFLTDTEAIVSLTGPTPALVRMQMVGQNPHPKISGSGPQAGASHYFKGTDASKWQDSVPHFLKVDYQEVYPGIDLTYYGNQRQLEYDFTVRPHANPKAIELKFSGVDQIEIGVEGDLILHTAAGDIRHQRPRVFQHRNGVEESVEGEFLLLGSDKVGFQIGKYDSGLPLVIDPKFVYSTYFGGVGSNGDIGYDVKVDAQGTAFVTGFTSSLDFFNTNLSPTAPGGGNIDGFVMKVDPTGTVVLSAMYFGGSSEDEGHRIALDSSGFVYVTGYTSSTNFPIVNGFQTTAGGKRDAYVMKVDNAVSQILFSSYIGGNNDDQSFGLSVDANNNVYVAGETSSTNLPLLNPIQASFGGGRADAFAVKLSADGTRLYSTYLGGIGNDRAFDVTSDADGYAYLAGFTTAAIPNVINALYGFPSDPEQAFLTKLSPDGRAISLFAYIGGVRTDEAVRVVLDFEGNVIISGYTNSPNFPVQSAIQPNNAGDFDIFLIKLRPDFDEIVFSTYIGSDGSESAPGLAVDSTGNIYLAGYTSSFEFPVVNGINIGVSGGNLHGDRDAYVMKLSPSGRILFSTYVGGRSADGAVGIAVDAAGNAYVTGFTLSDNFPVENAFQSELALAPFPGASDGILMKISADDVVTATPVVVPAQGAFALSTVGNSNSVKFAHATLDVPSGAIRPAGMAILDLRQGGSEVGEVAFPLLPFITNAVVYVNENAGQGTNIAMVNPSADPIDLSFFLTDRTGAQSHEGTITIPPYSSFAQPVSFFPFLLPANTAGTLSFSATAPVAAMAFRTFTEANGTILIAYLPLIYSIETRPITIPHFAVDSNWASEFLLVNNTELQMTGVVRFYSNAPNQADPSQAATPVEVQLDRGNFTEVPYNLAPRGSDSFTTITGETAINGYAQVIPDTGTLTPAATTVLTYSTEGISSLRTTVEAQIPANDFRLYVEYSGDFERSENRTIVTPFALSNPSNVSTDVTLTLVKMDGTPTGLSTTITLPPQGHLSTYVHRLPAFSSMPNPFQGIMLVHATGPGVASFGMRARISETGKFLGTTTGPIKENPGDGSTVIFPHILDGGGYATRFILFSDPSGAGTLGTMRFADENGDPLPLSVESGAISALWPPALPPAIAIPRLAEDFNGDGKADILWNDFFGNVFEGLMNGSTITTERFLVNVWTGWTIAGGGDFNGDGKSDVLWHEESGDVAIWLMDGMRIGSYSTIANLETNWSIAGVGDFNADGKADILWHNINGDVVIWWMDGTTVTGYSAVATVWTGWSIEGVGDFNGDGKADILWRDTGGNVSVWLMNGATVLSFRNIGNMPANVAVAGVEDFNGNGKADILWRDDSGKVSMWLMDGTTIVNSGLIATIWTGWNIVETGDFDGDGKSDILWRNEKGSEVIWFMNGLTITSYSEVGI